MKYALLAMLGAGCAMSGASSAEAQTAPGFSADLEVFDYSYREAIDEGTVKDDGAFIGLGIGYVETIGSGLFLRARLHVAFGSIDYSAPGEAGRSRLDNVPQQLGQLELHVGADVPAGGAVISPFVGLASRYLNDESGGRTTSDGMFGYDREIGFGYVPAGIAVRLPVSTHAQLALSAQYNLVVRGTATSKLSGIDARLTDLELQFSDGEGLEASAAVELPLGRTRISIGPFVRHWAIGRSQSEVLADPDGSGEMFEFYEPDNTTTEFGLRVAIGL